MPVDNHSKYVIIYDKDDTGDKGSMKFGKNILLEKKYKETFMEQRKLELQIF